MDCDALRDDQWERVKGFVPGGTEGKRGPRTDNPRVCSCTLRSASSKCFSSPAEGFTNGRIGAAVRRTIPPLPTFLHCGYTSSRKRYNTDVNSTEFECGLGNCQRCQTKPAEVVSKIGGHIDDDGRYVYAPDGKLCVDIERWEKPKDGHATGEHYR